jgi:hypothetical protein
MGERACDGHACTAANIEDVGTVTEPARKQTQFGAGVSPARLLVGFGASVIALLDEDPIVDGWVVCRPHKFLPMVLACLPDT